MSQQFLKSAKSNALLFVMLVCLGTSLAQAETAFEKSLEPSRRHIILRDGWLVKQLDTDKPDIAALAKESASPDKTWLPARMPAQVHDVLLAHGLIPDPHVGTNATLSAWVGEKNWIYVHRFQTPENTHERAFLRFEGLDTLADVWLNGRSLGHFENMFREYAIEVKDYLLPAGDSNVLIIAFYSPQQYMRATRLPLGDPNAAPHKSLRKCHSDFGSYLGARPHAVKAGIYRDVVLDLPERSWIEDACVRTTLSRNLHSAKINGRVETSGAGTLLEWALKDPSGRSIKSGQQNINPGTMDFSVSLKDPELWWPRMQGPQNLYTLELSLRGDGRMLDRRQTTFGIREVKPVLRDPVTGEKRFCFEVNGQPVFLRGGNWVPLEGATHVWQPERARQLLDLAEHGNMNALRIWGEGVLPPPSFYEECDRRGLALWQDFMFGYYDHAASDTNFLENCRLEVEGTIRRLRNHASIFLWCGGNEQYLWASTTNVPKTKRTVFEHLMSAACQKLDPTRLFHISSPYGGATGNWPQEGDWHDYTTINYEPEASVPLFGSEVLRVSVPSLNSMKRFLAEDELWPQGFDPAIRKPGQPAWPPAWAYHSTGIATWDRVGPVHEYCDPANAGELIRVIGTAHGEYLRDRVERERRGVPDGAPAKTRRCWGNLVWRLNDSWPIIYGSVVDYYLEPKIAYYHLRRAYEPVLVSFEKTPDRIFVWVINDSAQLVTGRLVVQRLDFTGKALGKLQADLSVKPGEAKRCLSTTELGEISLRTQFLQASFAGREATSLLIAERYLHLPDTHLNVQVANGSIEMSANNFARQVTLEFEGVTGAVFADNFFDLIPAQRKSIKVINAAGGNVLTVRALNAEPVRLQWKP